MSTPGRDARPAHREDIAAAFAALDDVAAGSPQVTVKRRRVAAAAAVDASSADGPSPAARAPKVHRIDRRDSPEPKPLDAPASGRPQAQDALPPVAPKRPRRRLHGKVDVVTPDREADAARESDGARAAAEAGGGDAARRGRFTGSFVGDAARRAEGLRAKAAELHARADRLRRQERTEILRWARAAIAEFGITARDLGL